jgi:formylglycine-generating enzyme required for sulfatase activity
MAYAYRGKTTTALPIGRTTPWEFMKHYTWYQDMNLEEGFKTGHSRGKMPLAWGLFDMPGNTWEWCHNLSMPRRDPHSARDARGGDNESLREQMLSYSFMEFPVETPFLNTGVRLVLNDPPDLLQAHADPPIAPPPDVEHDDHGSTATSPLQGTKNGPAN